MNAPASVTTPVYDTPAAMPLADAQLLRMHGYWQAANYLTVAQIYLLDNTLLREPLRPGHIKPRVPRHWATSPGVSFIYVHLNRLIKQHDVGMMLFAGPEHAGPAYLANLYLEGTYSEIYPEISQNATGIRRLCRQFSVTGGIASHALLHAFGAALDNPDLIVAAVIGDGDAETGPLAGSWKAISALNPARDGAVLPILQLNCDSDPPALLTGHGYEVHFVDGDDPFAMHQAFAAALDACYSRIRAIQKSARNHGLPDRPQGPALVLRTPEGWTGPGDVSLDSVRTDPEQLNILERWLRSYRPYELFDENGRLVYELASLAPTGDRRLGANPHANGGRLLVALDLPDFRKYAVPVVAPATHEHESTRPLRRLLQDTCALNAPDRNFRLFSSDLSPHTCLGWLEGYLLTGRHGLLMTNESLARLTASMTVQHVDWLSAAARLPWHAPLASMNVLLTSTRMRSDPGPGLIDVMLSKRAGVARIYLPPDANCLLSVADHCLRSRNCVNLIVIDQQPRLQLLDIDAAIEHCARGASVWQWASTDRRAEPDVVLACAGGVPTLETVAAAWWLRKKAPDLNVRVVNVVDLTALFAPEFHPHGMGERPFVELFTSDTPVVFASHGDQHALHQIVGGRPNPRRFHMLTGNGMSRFDLCAEALRRVARGRLPQVRELITECHASIAAAAAYSHEHLDDSPEIRNWVWTD